MYADFSTIRLHINEEEHTTLIKAYSLLAGMAEYIDEETDCKLILDVGEKDEAFISDFNVNTLWETIENLEKILDIV